MTIQASDDRGSDAEAAGAAGPTQRRMGHRRLNSHMVAAAAGVSQGTVSNVLNRPEKVAPATYERVMETIESLGFVPNRSARDLRNGRGSALGIVVLDVANPFWGELVRGAEEVATHQARAVIVCSSEGSPEKEAELLKLLESYQVECVLIAAVDTDAPHLAALRRRGTAVVLLERAEAAGDAPAVGTDDVVGGRLAAEHLLAMGHRRVAFVNGPHTIASCRDRAQGVREAFAGAGSGAVTEITVPTLTAREGFHATETVLSQQPGVTAVFCANDMIALGVLRGLASRGVRVPEQVSIVGYDDADFAALLSPALTTIRIDPMEIGRRAARAALRISAGADDPVEDGMLEPHLVERDSVARLAR